MPATRSLGLSSVVAMHTVLHEYTFVILASERLSTRPLSIGTTTELQPSTHGRAERPGSITKSPKENGQDSILTLEFDCAPNGNIMWMYDFA